MTKSYPIREKSNKNPRVETAEVCLKSRMFDISNEFGGKPDFWKEISVS